MKPNNSLHLLLTMSSLALLLGGCLTKPARVPIRHFVLVPLPASAHTPATGPRWSVEVGFVKMPVYLLRDSMFVRKSTAEIEYLEDALWAERLDQAFRHVLAENLSALLATNRVHGSGPAGDWVVRVSVNVERFEVDTQGQGTLLASWRLTAAGADKPMKTGQARLTRPGPAPLGNPQAIATTLSALVEEFSRDLVRALSDSAEVRQ